MLKIPEFYLYSCGCYGYERFPAINGQVKHENENRMTVSFDFESPIFINDRVVLRLNSTIKLSPQVGKSKKV